MPTVMEDPIYATPKGRRLTQHARESLIRHGFQEPFNLIDDIIDNASRVATQNDGASVYIRRVERRRRSYDIVIESDKGIITAMRHLTRRELKNLGRNYGFDPIP
jgi:filamentous hemagglutinin